MKEVDKRIVDTIRVISAEGVEKANSGHPGLPMGAAPMAYALWANVMNHSPKNPNWYNRDRFILSAGHGSMMLYTLLHLFDYGLTIDDLKNFRQWGSKTPGHPEYRDTVGVEATTGPLGAGLAMGVGMAMAESNLAATYNKEDIKLIDHYTYVLAGDGCLMEGITSEASSLAGTLKLGKLIVMYDSNKITIEGSTDLAFTEDVAKRYEAYGWQVLEVEDGNHDLDGITMALEEAKKDLERPSLVIIKTTIGYGSKALSNTADVHGAPLGKENLLDLKKKLDFPLDKEFYLPEEIKGRLLETVEKGNKAHDEWQALLKTYTDKYPTEAKELLSRLEDNEDLSSLDSESYWKFDNKPLATRVLSGQIIQRIAPVIKSLVGGSADLAPSTKTIMENEEFYSAENYKGRNLRFGVRELAMAGIMNGLALHGGFKVYGATFFVFSDYMKPMMRLAALMKLPTIYVLTHDSIGVGEDGPTHQPVEQLASLRSIPNLTVFRPADGKETAAGWYYAVHSKKTPTALVLTRQNLPYYEETGKEALKGAYILKDTEKEPDVILMASGSEVELIYEAAKELDKDSIKARVVSMPSFELFEQQEQAYKDRILPPANRKRFAVEAASSFGWYKYIGLDGKMISIDRFGASAPANQVFEAFGYSVENIVKQVKDYLHS